MRHEVAECTICLPAVGSLLPLRYRAGRVGPRLLAKVETALAVPQRLNIPCDDEYVYVCIYIYIYIYSVFFMAVCI